MSEVRLALAIQKPTGKSNLGDDTLSLLQTGGLEYYQKLKRRDLAPTNLTGVDLWLARNKDITLFTSLGVLGKGAGMGIVGMDKFTEFKNGTSDRPTPTVVKDDLGYSMCTLMLGVHKSLEGCSLEDLEDLTVATSYAKGTRRFFEEAGVNVRILECEGGAETLVFTGAAQAVVEVSDTGTSFRDNDIVPLAPVEKSQAILIADPRLGEIPELAGAAWRVLRTVMTGIYDRDLRMMKLNFPDDRLEEIMAVLPARESPTTSPLRETGWSAAESLVPLAVYNEVKQELYRLGAKDIFRLPIEDPSPNPEDPEVNRMMRVIYGDGWTLPSPLYSIV